MMQSFKLSLHGILTIALVVISVLGCVQIGASVGSYERDGYERDDDCMFCHGRSGARNAKDFSNIYSNEAGHHPVYIEYPPNLNREEKFNFPTAQLGNLMYFDNNSNDKLDDDEIRLYPEKNGREVILTCATCHREHSKAPEHAEYPVDDFLRGTNVDGELCLNCHRTQQKQILHH